MTRGKYTYKTIGTSLIGTRYGMWTVSGQPFRNRNTAGRRPHVVCRCDCGHVDVVSIANLRTGLTMGCGCVQETAGRKSSTHPQEYCIWSLMILRCTNPKVQSYQWYGARGIKVCNRWMDSIHNFLEDMGPRPGPEFSLDRIDNDGPYAPENCRWATLKQQSRNRSTNRILTAFGKSQTLIEWSEESGLRAGLISVRIGKLGWAIERALSTKPRILRRTKCCTKI